MYENHISIDIINDVLPYSNDMHVSSNQNQTLLQVSFRNILCMHRKTQCAFVESWIECECKDELTMHRCNRLYKGGVERWLLRRTPRNLYSPARCGMADIDAIAIALPLSATCF